MKAAPHIDYKALYEQGLQHEKQQRKVIALLQDDVSKSIKEQQRLGQVLSSMQKVLIQKEQQTSDLQTIINAHEQTIHSQGEKIRQQESIITSQNKLVEEQKKEFEPNRKDLTSLALVKHELKVLKKMIHGRRSEKHYPSEAVSEQNAKAGEQLTMNMEVDALATCHIKSSRLIPAYIRLVKEVTEKKPHPGRHDWPEGLREELVILDPADKPEGSVFLRFEDTRQLACTNTEFYLKVYRRYIYMAPTKEGGTCKQLIAPLPAHPIAKCKADSSVLVKLIIDKFIYHLPVWRQQQRFKQYGIDLQYNTLCHWINRIGDVLEPLYLLLLRELIISKYLMMDETTYRVLDMRDIRTMVNNRVLYTCNALLTCADIFIEARSNDLKRSEHALEHFFAPLYAIEENCRTLKLTYDEISEKRGREATPVLDGFYEWLQQELPKVIPGTPIYNAIAYALNRFNTLRIYITDGMLEIDNNFTERLIRPTTIGRKNYMFAGSYQAGQRAAIIYSLLGTCKLQGIDLPGGWMMCSDVYRINPKINLSNCCHSSGSRL